LTNVGGRMILDGHNVAEGDWSTCQNSGGAEWESKGTGGQGGSRTEAIPRICAWGKRGRGTIWFPVGKVLFKGVRGGVGKSHGRN